MSDVSDTPPEDNHAPITPDRTVSARTLTRDTADLLREVADEQHTIAVTHFGRVVAFVVPKGARVAVKHRGIVSQSVGATEAGRRQLWSRNG
ncbi:MAG: hypothetical protein M3271_10870 [Actinomycetota bacterium]|nr:hypothetical protein [Actinomycetota bacterium]